MADTKENQNSDISILVVDDEENLGNILAMALKNKGYVLESCTDPTEALKKVKTYKYQIVLSDVKMPKLNGIELLKEIRKVSSIIQVIMLTGYSSLELALECMDAGAVDFLFKPFEDLQEVYDAVDESAKKVRRWRRVSAKAGKISRLDTSNVLDTNR